MFKVIGKSVLKAGKYVGLTAAGAAVGAVAGVFEPAELLRLLQAAVDGNDPLVAILLPLIATSVGGAVGPVLVVAVQQILKHRNDAPQT